MLDDPLARLTAALSDRYRIERELGAGGMATVYLAEDLKHKRKVALKVLKPELAAVLGADRFVQEITTTAALQHPHILPLFDSGTADGFLFYVMPFIDGETLRSKLDRETQLGIDESVKIATNVADALDYAHRHGVVHRDIKPENILLHEGRPMVADFGIALALSAAAGGRMTETGLSLGTPHYMSPEQATAEKDIGARSDIYSLASVLYEMLAGQPPHLGGSAQQIIMKIITEVARPVTQLRKSVPQHVEDALATALEKLPADRFASAREFAEALQGTHTARGTVNARRRAPTTPWVHDRRSQISIGAILLFAVLAAASSVRTFTGRETRANEQPVMTRLSFAPGDRIAASKVDKRANGSRPSRSAFAVSPDGNTLVYVGERNGVNQLFVRSLNSETAAPIAGTEDAESPCFSPDGKAVAYWVAGRLMRVPLTGGAPTQIALVNSLRGMDWMDDRIAVGDVGGGIIVLSVTGTAKPDTVVPAGATLPRFISGGNALLFTQRIRGRRGLLDTKLEVISIDRRDRKILIDDAADGRYVNTGHLVFARAGTMMAVAFDERRLLVKGGAVVVLSDVMQAVNGTNTDVQTSVMQAVVTAQGHLLYFTGGVTPDRERQLVWRDRQGRATPITAAGKHPFFALRFSPDETKVAASITGLQKVLYVFDLARNTGQTLTDPGAQMWPIWTPDGRRIVRTGLVHDKSALVWSLADGSRPAESLVKDKVVAGAPTFWSPDGSEVFVRIGNVGTTKLQAINMATGATRTIANLPSDVDYATVSPDYKWLAYTSADPSIGRPEVYVQPWPALDRKWKISEGGGHVPKWTKGGKELLYGQSAGTDSAGQTQTRMWAVAIQYQPDFSPGPPQPLFTATFASTTGVRSFDVTADGSKFLMMEGPPQRAPTGDLHLVMNWTADLKRLAKQGTE
jgi:eukaryotic-like serine/threonine-protein kinase